MPWTGKSFRKHNKKLKGKSAKRAAKVANAILRKTGKEGLAIRVANAQAKRKRRKKRG